MNVDADVALRTVGLTKSFGRLKAVDAVALEVRRGQVYGFLGPNGSGKTTTIGMVLDLLHPTSGHVEIFGREVRANVPATLGKTGAVVEGAAFYPHLSGRDNLRVWGLISGGVPEKRLDEALDIVGLSARAHSKAANYSLGMRQRLSLAAALLHDPGLLVLDEPTNGLDPAGMRDIRRLIKELGRAGKAIFVSSHLLGEVEQMCDYVGILKSGRLIAQGAVADLVQRSDSLLLEVTDAETAYRVLNSLDWIGGVQRDGTRLTVSAPRSRAAEISRELAKHEVYLSELRPQENSLEDLFMELTEETAGG